MHLILGGRFMGKLAYAESLYGRAAHLIDLASSHPKSIDDNNRLLGCPKNRLCPENRPCRMTIINLQDGVRQLMTQDANEGSAMPAEEFFGSRLELLKDSVLIGTEIGSGVVPIDSFERRWRDETGLLYQMLAREADIVDRVWAGLPMRIKG